MFHLVILFLLIAHLTSHIITYYRREAGTKRFCKDLKDHATRIVDFKRKFITPLTKDEEDSYNNKKKYHICMKDLNNDKVKDYC